VALPCGRPRRLVRSGRGALLLGASLAIVCVDCVAAEEHVVNTRAARWVPMVLFIEPGDRVVWRGMEGHETEVLANMAPAGAMPWRSELDDEGFMVTFDQEGAYVYTCLTHMNAGMVGAIVVGGVPHNLAALEAAVTEIEIGRNFVQSLLQRLKREINRRLIP